MKREFLENLDLGEGVKLPKSAVDAIMAENGKDIETAKAPVATLTMERDGLRTRLEDANRKLEGYDPEWRDKAEQANLAAQTEIAEMRNDLLIREALGGYVFTSGFARDGVHAKVKAAGLKASEDGKTLLGLEDLMKTIREQNPDAFKETNDDGGNTAGVNRTPFAVAGTGFGSRGERDVESGNLRAALSAALFPKTE